jgi:hypothetical protein
MSHLQLLIAFLPVPLGLAAALLAAIATVKPAQWVRSRSKQRSDHLWSIKS